MQRVFKTDVCYSLTIELLAEIHSSLGFKMNDLIDFNKRLLKLWNTMPMEHTHSYFYTAQLIEVE